MKSSIKLLTLNKDDIEFVTHFPRLLVKYITKDNNQILYYRCHIIAINLKVKYIWAKDFLNELNCIKPNKVYERRHSKLFTNCHVSWIVGQPVSTSNTLKNNVNVVFLFNSFIWDTTLQLNCLFINNIKVCQRKFLCRFSKKKKQPRNDTKSN